MDSKVEPPQGGEKGPGRGTLQPGLPNQPRPAVAVTWETLLFFGLNPPLCTRKARPQGL